MVLYFLIGQLQGWWLIVFRMKEKKPACTRTYLSSLRCIHRFHAHVLPPTTLWFELVDELPVSMQLCTLCVCPTWSSRGRSQKAGMYLAHSTRTRSCCFMDSHTSVMAAIFLVRMSPLSMGVGDEIWARQPCVGEALLTASVDECRLCLPYLSREDVSLDECVDGW